MRPLVLDTNVVLDLLVFADPRTHALRQALDEGAVRWIATAAMRDELAHVMAYPNLAARAQAHEVLRAFDTRAQAVDTAPISLLKCRDGDDQKFVDLAVAHKAILLSKDKEVLRLRKRLAAVEVPVAAFL